MLFSDRDSIIRLKVLLAVKLRLTNMKHKDSSWRLKFWRIPHLDNLELMHAFNVTHHYPPHLHEEYCLVIVLRGVETHICHGQSYEARAGCLMFLNAHEPHSSRSLAAEYRVIRIRPEALNRIGLEVIGRNLERSYFSSPVIEDPLIFRRLLDLHLKLEQNTSLLEQESELISAIGLLVARQNYIHPGLKSVGREPQRIKEVQDYLKSHYAENVSLSQLASIAKLSPFYLLRAFHNHVGFPPHEYQIQTRISHARQLIHNGHSLSQVAQETGFFDQSHLSRNFKRIVGIPPGRYLSHSNIVQDGIKGF
jgi:AraC-like DNA-binding protein